MKKFNLQLFADSYTSSYEVVIPLTSTNESTGEDYGNFTFKIPNPKNGLTLAEVTTMLNTLNSKYFFTGAHESDVVVSTRETPYIETKSTVTLDLEE